MVFYIFIKESNIFFQFYLLQVLSLLQGSRDNMSIVLVTFPAAPKPNPEAQKKEAELEMDIERRIKGSLTFPYSNQLYSLCCCINTKSQYHTHT